MELDHRDVARFYAVNWWNAVATWNAAQAIRMAVAVDRHVTQSRVVSTTRRSAGPTPSGPANADGGTWGRLAQCESSGNAAAATGNGFYGLYQFTTSSWRAVGGSGLPSDATASEQTYRAQRLLELQGPGAWPRCSYVAGLR